MGSPIKESSDDLVKLAKKLKKNNIAVDLVNFGEEAENAEKLENFIKSVNTSDERCVRRVCFHAIIHFNLIFKAI